MEVLLQGLPPRVEDRQAADLAAQVARVVPKRRERLPRRVEKEAVEDPRVPLGEGVQGMGQGEDHMEILDRQQLRLPRREPALFGQRLALRAVPVPTGVVGDPERPAVVTLFRVPAQGDRPAGRDGPEGPVLPSGQAVGLPVRRPVGLDEVRELDPARRARPDHGLGRRRGVVQPVQRGRGLQDGPSG